MLKKILIVLTAVLVLSTSSHAGWKWNTFKAGITVGTVKTYKAYKKKHPKSKIFTKKKINNRTIYQRDIDPNLIIKRNHPITKKKIIETNRDRMKNGKPPYIIKNGKTEPVELHHSRQNDKGSLFELSKSTHRISNKEKGAKALHPYGKNKHPNNPLPEKRNIFDKERNKYWKDRNKRIEDFNSFKENNNEFK